MFKWALALLVVCSTFQQAVASDQHYLIAQNELSDVSDPFSDFSEFSEGSEEEADVNFFRNGRFINFGLMFGYQIYTSQMAEVFGNSTPFGFFLNYFFDLRFAAQFTYISGQGTFAASSLNEKVSTNSNLTLFSIDIKYYMNTDNVTKGLAQFNPYMIVGFTQVSRTLSNYDTANINRDSTNGFEIGAGMEIPIMDNNLFVGGQMLFHLINFENENQEIELNSEQTGKFPSGDVMTFMFLLGKNF